MIRSATACLTLVVLLASFRRDWIALDGERIGDPRWLTMSFKACGRKVDAPRGVCAWPE
jgi:hypothetical protein